MKSKPVAPYVVAVISSLAVILVAYLVFFSPKLNEAGALEKKVADTNTANDALQTRSDVLKGKVDHLSEATAQVAAFEKSFPSDPSQQDLISSILDAASATGVTVTGINPSAPAPITPDAAAVAAAAAPAAPAAPAAGSSTDPGAAADAAAAKPAAPEDFSKVLAGVPLTINASGDPNALVVFMQRIESLKRPFTATEVTLVRGSDGTGLLTLVGQSFLSAPLAAPKTDAAPAGTAPSAPADAPAATTAPSAAAAPAPTVASTPSAAPASPAPSPTASK